MDFALFVFSTLVSPVILLIPLGLLLLDLLIVLTIILETRRNYSAVKDFQKQIHYHFNRQGYTANDGKSSSNVSWESVSKAVESGQGINLFLGRTQFAMIPRRCFKTTDDFQTTREILKTALGEKAQLI